LAPLAPEPPTALPPPCATPAPNGSGSSPPIARGGPLAAMALRKPVYLVDFSVYKPPEETRFEYRKVMEIAWTHPAWKKARMFLTRAARPAPRSGSGGGRRAAAGLSRGVAPGAPAGRPPQSPRNWRPEHTRLPGCRCPLGQTHPCARRCRHCRPTESTRRAAQASWLQRPPFSPRPCA
jgi:hypothetical protein